MASNIVPLTVPRLNKIGGLPDVVDHNAGLILVAVKLTPEGVLTLSTFNGEEMEADLSAVYLTRSEYAEGDASNAGPSNEEIPGLIRTVSEEDIANQAEPDDSKAMTLAKTLLLLTKRGIPTFDATGAKSGDILIHTGERFAASGLSDELVKLFKNPTNDFKAAFCALVALCGGGSTTPPTTTPTVDPEFDFVHYELVDVPSNGGNPQTYPYVLDDGTYAGTFDYLGADGAATWAIKRGVSGWNIDLKWRIDGTTDALQSSGLNLPPNRERQDVVDAPGVNTPDGKLCGRVTDVPEAWKQGVAVQVHAFIAGTNIELKDSPRVITLPKTATPVSGDYRIYGDNASEGGVARQQVLQQHYTDGSWVDIAAEKWGMQEQLAGVTIASGAFQAAANSVNGTTFVTIYCQPVGSSQVVSVRRQIVDTGCTRDAGVQTFTLTWNIAPANQGAHRFDTMAQANNEMGAYYNNPSAYTVGQFPFQTTALAKGAKAFNNENTTSCERVDNGIFHVSDASKGNTIKKAITITDGLISDIQDTTYQAANPVPDTSWATLADPMDSRPPGYVSANRSTWNYANGLACLDASNMASQPNPTRQDTGALVLDKNADRILVRIRTGRNDIDNIRYGVGLKYDTTLDPDSKDQSGNQDGTIKGGYNFLLFRTNGVRGVTFLNDHRAFSPFMPIEWDANTWYYVAMQYTRPDANTRRLVGKFWKETENEPANWAYSYDVPSRSGLAAVVGGSVDNNGNKAEACIDKFWLQEVGSVAPLLTNVAKSKPVTASFDPGLGAGWVPSNLVDGDSTVWTTGCILTDTVVYPVIDLQGRDRPQQVALTPRPDFPNAMPIDYTIDGSFDGRNWYSLGPNITGQARGKDKVIHNLATGSDGQYQETRYIRVRSTKNGRAEATDCIRTQISEIEVLAPVHNALTSAQAMSVIKLARAFVGTGGATPDNDPRDVMYFADNGIDPPSGQLGVGPYIAFRNSTKGQAFGVSYEMASLQYAIDNPPAGNDAYQQARLSYMIQARNLGHKWYAWTSQANQGEVTQARIYGKQGEPNYQDWDYPGPADHANVDLGQVFPTATPNQAT